MHYTNDPKIVFVAIPKTGTRSIVQYLEKYFGAKKGARTHEDTIPPQFRKHYSFTVVRNPFDRIASEWWAHCCRPKGKWYGMGLMTYIKKPKWREFQHPYLKNNNLDKVLHFETLEDDFKTLPFYIEGTTLEWLNPTVYKTDNNPTPRPSTEELFTPDIRRAFIQKYKKDFVVTGYSMEE